jgi:hypothetical protein
MTTFTLEGQTVKGTWANDMNPIPEGIIDPDRIDTWPQWLTEWAESSALRFRDGSYEVPNFGVDPEREDDFRAMFQGQLVVAHHFSRLFDHEVEEVKVNGLKRLTKDMLYRKIQVAHELGLITQEHRKLFEHCNVIASGESDHRAGQICLVAGTGGLNDDVGAVYWLLTLWGGEALSMSNRSSGMKEILRNYGRPAIVVAAISVDSPHKMNPAYSLLSSTFLRTYLGHEALSDYFVRSEDIPGTRILDVWQPGRPEYEKFTNFPQ